MSVGNVQLTGQRQKSHSFIESKTHRTNSASRYEGDDPAIFNIDVFKPLGQSFFNFSEKLYLPLQSEVLQTFVQCASRRTITSQILGLVISWV